MKLSEKERLAYDRYVENRRSRRSIDQSNYDAGKIEGKKQGKLEGEKSKALQMAKALKGKGIDISIIAETSGLLLQEIEHI